MAARRDPPLTLDEIVDTALVLIATDGLDALSMRTLSVALGVTPMAVYHHVADKSALVDLAADSVVARVPVPAAELPWDAWLAEYHDGLWKQLRGYPDIARHLLEHPSTPAGAAIRQCTVEVLRRDGFDERTALLATSTFHTHLLGRLAVHALPVHEQRSDEPSWSAHGLTADEYATFGLETVLIGLRARAPKKRA